MGADIGTREREREAYFTSHTRTEKCAEVVEIFISGNQTFFFVFVFFFLLVL